MTITTTTQHASTEIPVIDIAGDESLTGPALIQAAANSGFVYIKNLGQDIPVKSIDHTFDLSRNFFASPVEEKEPCVIQKNNRGWSGMHSETLDAKNQRVGDFKEAFNFGEFENGKAQQPLPPAFAPNEADMNAFFTQCHTLCLKILKLFGVGLKIDSEDGGSTWFSSRHDPTAGPSGCTLRLLYYPSIPSSSDYRPDVDIRAGAHSDYGSITLLFQRPGQPGLEILSSDNTWVPVPVFPPGTESDPSPPILVNIGDLLSHWTNGLLKSTVHRVIFPKGEGVKVGGEDRYSIAYFCHPASETRLVPVPSEMVRERNREKEADGKRVQVKVLTASEHLQERLAATYLGLYNEDDKARKVEAAA